MSKHGKVNKKIKIIRNSTGVPLNSHYNILFAEQFFQPVHKVSIIFYKYSRFKIICFFVIIVKIYGNLSIENSTHFRCLNTILAVFGPARECFAGDFGVLFSD